MSKLWPGTAISCKRWTFHLYLMQLFLHNNIVVFLGFVNCSQSYLFALYSDISSLNGFVCAYHPVVPGSNPNTPSTLLKKNLVLYLSLYWEKEAGFGPYLRDSLYFRSLIEMINFAQRELIFVQHFIRTFSSSLFFASKPKMAAY